MDADHEPDGADGAEQAFEALREEVAALRRGVELVYRQQQAVPVAPDYSPTLGVIAQELRTIGTRLDGMGSHSALRLTPAAYAEQMAAGVRQVIENVAKGHAYTGSRLDDAVKEMRALVGTAHGRIAQERREYVAVAIGVAFGLVVWWPLAHLLPWSGGDRLAGTLVDLGGRWDAGQTLMKEAYPNQWERMARLYKACPEDTTTDLCEAAMAVRTIPPDLPASSDKGRPAPLLPPPKGKVLGH